MSGTRTRALGQVLTVAFLAAVVGWVAAGASAGVVDSGPVVFSSHSPADSAVATVTPLYVSVLASDTLPLTGYARITLDGAVMIPGLDYPIGHWEWDEYEYEWWVVDDPTLVRMSVHVTPVDGSHSATATIVNSAGATSTSSWSFDVAVPPRVVSVTPADGAVIVGDRPTVSARITDNDTSDLATMTVDGVSVATTYSAGTRTYSYVPPVALADGSHAVTFTAEDAGGRTVTRTWTFVVDTIADTTFSSLSPAPGSTVTTWSTQVSALITDTASVYSWYIKGYVDGVTSTVHANYPIGYWVDDEYEPWFEVSNWGHVEVWWDSGVLTDGTHTAMLRTTNSRGLPATGTWDFEVQAKPRISGTLPRQGRSLQPTISAYVSDNSTGAIDVTMTVDGSVAAASYDPVSHLLAYRPPVPFTDFSTHTVQVDAEDLSGNTETESWQFFVQTVADARFSAWAPAGGTLLTTSTVAFSVTATDTSPLTGACTMALDGSPAAASVSYPCGHWEWDYEDSWYVVDDPGHVVLDFARTGVTDGLHTVEATVTDADGLTAHDSWQFTVESPPRATALLPVADSDVPTRTPTISGTVTDNGADPIDVVLTLDGAQVPASLDATGRFEYTPADPLEDDATHTVTLDVEDSRGNASHYEWAFRVQKYPDMPTSNVCTTCHVGYPEPNHPMNNCSGCHHAGNGHGVLLPWTPVSGCSCHGGSHGPYQISGQSEYYYPWQCTDCHKPLYGWIPRHPDDTEATHETTRSLTACRPCHKQALTREHYRYPAGGPQYTCLTCHDSVSSEVTQAIAAGDTVCESCHGSVGAYHDDHASSQAAVLANGEKACSTCHATDIWTEHTKATTIRHAEECLLCHEVSGDETISAPVTAPWSGSCTVSGCHTAGSGREIHTYWCLGCHDIDQPDFAVAKVDFAATSTVEQDACAACHWIGAHPAGHPQDRDCSVCHPAWAARTDWYWAKALTPSGWFESPASLEATAGRIHDIHAAGSWPQEVTDRSSKCASCHGPAACSACHSGADPAHTPHALPTYPAASYRIATGTAEGVTGSDTTAIGDSACANASCHPPAKAVWARTVKSWEDTSTTAAYTGSWIRNVRKSGTYGGTYAYSATANAVVKVTFTGPGSVQVFGARAYNAGILELSIDGGTTRTVDCYSPDGSVRALLQTATVGAGTHTLRIRSTGTKNAASTGRYVYFDSVKVTREAPSALFVPKCSACHAARVATHW